MRENSNQINFRVFNILAFKKRLRRLSKMDFKNDRIE